MTPCQHNPPQFVSGEPFQAGRDCRLCWLFANKPSYQQLWGSNGTKVKESKTESTKKKGVGATLAAMFKELGIKPKAGCKCKKRAREMDRKGPQWCRDNVDTIVGWLREEAERQGIPIVFGFNLGARLVVLKAINEAENQLGDSH